MPLVVPGINSNYGNENQSKAAEWLNKLAGKRLSDKHDELVRVTLSVSPPLRLGRFQICS